MIQYAIKIEGEYFKEYIYYDKKMEGRYGGNTALGSVIQDGDIVDIITTEKPERFEVGRSIGNTISILVNLDKLQGKTIEIVPIER